MAFSLGAVVAVNLVLRRGSRGKRFGRHLRPVDDPWPRRSRRRQIGFLGVAPWIALFTAAIAWDVLGIDTGPHQYHLTISALAQAYRPLNAALLLVWMLAGIGYAAARARAPLSGTGDPIPPLTPDPDAPGAALGAGMLAVGGSHPGATGLLLPSSPPVGVAFWITVAIAGVAIDLVARRSHGRVANAEELTRLISTSTVLNIVLIAAWVFAGYHLLTR